MKQAKAKAKAKDKRGAMMCLKKKNLKQSELDSLGNTKFQLEQQVREQLIHSNGAADSSRAPSE